MLIAKGDHKLEVSKNTFEIMFKRLGYKEVKAAEKVASQPSVKSKSVSKEIIKEAVKEITKENKKDNSTK